VTRYGQTMLCAFCAAVSYLASTKTPSLLAGSAVVLAAALVGFVIGSTATPKR